MMMHMIMFKGKHNVYMLKQTGGGSNKGGLQLEASVAPTVGDFAPAGATGEFRVALGASKDVDEVVDGFATLALEEGGGMGGEASRICDEIIPEDGARGDRVFWGRAPRVRSLGLPELFSSVDGREGLDVCL